MTRVRHQIYSIILWVRVKKATFNGLGIFLLPLLFKIHTDPRINLAAGEILLNKTNSRSFHFSLLNRTWIAGYYKFQISAHDLEDAQIHNPIAISIQIDDQVHTSGIRNNPIFQIFMSLAMWRYILQYGDRSIFFRLSPNFKSIITVRDRVISDSRNNQLKISFAGIVSILMFWLPDNWRPVLMYEKESEKFEESASILFKYIKNKGHGRVYFVISELGLQKYAVPKKYHDYILIKGTFKHYIYFCLCDVFIGTEAPAHALDLRAVNPFINYKLWRNRMRFVFLQHGVMYMVSLASEARKTFRRGKIYPIRTKIVVSSDLEALHFIKDGNYFEDDLYVTGLPKFDHPDHNPSADKIVVMPTWRPWEYNLVSGENYKTSGYYKMLQAIVKSIPESLQDKVIILPHPLFFDAIKKTDLSNYLIRGKSYDNILYDCDILITDYSSISYDAFNRGAKVIFWWADKDYCMDQYGGHLMLTSELAFGPQVYTEAQLQSTIHDLYKNIRGILYQEKFRKIVFDFHNKSTELLYSKILMDGFI